jgi:hypothetical protein
MSAMQADIDNRHEAHPLWPVIYTFETERGRIGVPLHKMPRATSLPTESVKAKSAIRKNVQFLRNVGFLPKVQEKTNLKHGINITQGIAFTRSRRIRR